MSDYNFLMESRLSPEQFQVLNQLSRIAGEQGQNLYLVGGAVRDLTYGQQTIRDLDFAVEGNPLRMVRGVGSGRVRAALPGELRTPGRERPQVQVKEVRSNARLNSAEVRFSRGVRAEIAMSRSETYSKPGRRPEIAPAMIFEDLKRRDFSVDAMGVSLHPNSRGLLLDPTNGAADIEKRELRVLHSRSLIEDPSRIYRLFRLAMRLRFKPEERTRNYLESALASRAWTRLETAEQGRELAAILREENPARVLKMLVERGLLAGLDRKLASSRIPYERFARIRNVAHHIPSADPFVLNFYCLVERLGGGQKVRLARKIIGPGKTLKMALSLEREGRKLARAVRGSKGALPSRLYNLLVNQAKTLLLFVLLNYPQAKIQSRIKNFLHKFPLVRARIPRAQFQAMGAKPAPKFEKILDRLFFDQLDGKIRTPKQLFQEFRKLTGIKEPPPPKPAKRAKPAKAAKAEKPAKPSKSAKPPRTAKAAKAGKRAKPTAPARPAASKKKARK